jgi:hypothetical protein
VPVGNLVIGVPKCLYVGIYLSQNNAVKSVLIFNILMRNGGTYHNGLRYNLILSRNMMMRFVSELCFILVPIHRILTKLFLLNQNAKGYWVASAWFLNQCSTV